MTKTETKYKAHSGKHKWKKGMMSRKKCIICGLVRDIRTSKRAKEEDKKKRWI